MAGEPWLDSLSDDWEAPPPPAVPSPTQSHVHSSVAPPSRVSRIPRYVSPHKNPALKPNAHTPALDAENPSADSNADVDRQRQEARPEVGTHTSNTTTVSSAQSVIKHTDLPHSGAVNEIEINERLTPEWQHLASSKQDLFSPMGLEGIFQRPQDIKSSPNKQSFSFYDLTHMPSSPPPWPSRTPSSGAIGGSDKHTPAKVAALPEQEENASVASQSSSHSVLKNHRTAQKSVNALPSSSSSVTDGFSPVYISKHNTVDGRVDYTAVDPAALPKLSKHVNLDRGGNSEAGDFKARPLSPSMSTSAITSDSLAPSDSVSQTRTTETCVHSPNAPPIPADQDQSPQNKPYPRSENSQASLKSNTLHEGSRPSVNLRSQSAQTVVERPMSPVSAPSMNGDQHSVQRRSFVQRTRSSPASTGVEAENFSGASHQQTTPRSGSIGTNVTRLHHGEQARQLGSVAGKKRKDARYDNDRAKIDSSVVASRDILRPRNPTPWQRHGGHERSVSANDLLSSEAYCEMLSSPQMQVSGLLKRSSGSVKARALALEAASLRQRQRDKEPSYGSRKKSVSTQDYLNEAMRIMDLIRSRKQAAASDWSSNTGADSELREALDFDQHQDSLPLSQAPTREGSPSGWRTQASRHVDPQVESRLRRYEETGDESFLVSSIVRSVRITEQKDYQHEQDGVRIIDNPHREGLRRSSDPGLLRATTGLGNFATTRSSNGDTDGSGETQKTSSTQKLSSIGRIAPEMVKHLIEDSTGGMRFDTQRQTWVKCKAQRARSSSTNLPASSAATDDDPLGQIPDLSVHEPAPLALPKRSETKMVPPVDDLPDSKSYAAGKDSSKPPMSDSTCQESWLGPKESVFGRPDAVILPEDRDKRDDEDETASPAGESFITPVEVDIPMQSVEPTGAVDEELDAIADLPSPKERPRRREQSVLFSSPPVSRAWDAKNWTDSTDPNRTIEVDEDDEDFDPDNSQLVPFLAQSHTSAAARRKTGRHWSRNVSMSHSAQHQEISFVEQRPDGRTYSLSMSVSTPLPARNRPNSAVVPSSGLRNCSFMDSLSPLSEFSVSNEDGHHAQNHALSRPVEVVEHNGRTAARSALATNQLVEKLSDAEPDEPYWDFMHRLSLADQGLNTLNMLDEFCPRLEELNASRNQLQHLNGAPRSLRHLDMSSNHLSSLTDLSHLQNLQTVNLANNGLSTLASFSSLVHLRELNLDNNQIADVEGILDLDGLMSASLRYNKLSTLDFSSAQLKRLSSLNVSHNSISSIAGLSALTALDELDLSYNELPGQALDHAGGNTSLRTLKADDNKLTGLDMACWPYIQTLTADDNRMVSISNVSTHESLQTIRLRNQGLDAKTSFTGLNDFSNVVNIILSGTSLEALLPLSVPFLNLRTLDVSFTGIQALPSDFGALVPNLQILNINANSIKDLRPLEGIVGLKKLHAAHNRLSRLRNFVKAAGRLGALLKGGGVLDQIDIRGNPLTLGFYASTDGSMRSVKGTSQADGGFPVGTDLQQPLPDQEAQTDELHASRLDDDMKMKRRVYEMLIASKCPKLTKLDGLAFKREKLQERDEVWGKLMHVGVVQKVG